MRPEVSIEELAAGKDALYSRAWPRAGCRLKGRRTLSPAQTEGESADIKLLKPCTDTQISFVAGTEAYIVVLQNINQRQALCQQVWS
jgi:hypothetical protein